MLKNVIKDVLFALNWIYTPKHKHKLTIIEWSLYDKSS